MHKISRRGNRRHIWSFFTGGMGLDVGLGRAGFKTTLAVEVEKDCRRTIQTNRPDIFLPEIPLEAPGDIQGLTGDILRQQANVDGDVFLMHGGPPCQSFCTGGKRAALNDPRGNLIYHYLRMVGEVRPRFFIMENVGSLLTAAIKHRPIKLRPGQHWSLKKYAEGKVKSADGFPPLSKEEMSGSAIRQILKDAKRLGYSLSFGLLNSADFGAPQKRYRFIILGSRDRGSVEFPHPSHSETGGGGRERHTHLRDVIWDIRSNPGFHSEYTEGMVKYFKHIPPGGNWRNLPPRLQPKALGKSFFAGGGKTGFFRRLDWDSPAPTLTGRANRKGTAICHPEATRPLSVHECARIQGFPDSWNFAGSMSSQYLQIGNAVPVKLGEALGRALNHHLRVKRTTRAMPWETQLEIAICKLRATARNRIGRRRAQNDSQLNLFSATSK